jgi:membrane protease YdiL (CAAX protease family)
VTNAARLVLWSGFIGILVALAYYGRATGDKPASDILYRYDTAVAAAFSYAIVLGVVLAIAGGRPDLLGIDRVPAWGRALGLGFGVFVGILALSRALDPFLHAGQEQGLTPPGWDPSRAGQYAANFAVIAVLGPIVEELTYRGLGYSLFARFGDWIAIAVTGIAFGLSHGLVDALPILTAFGWGLAWLRRRTGSVYPGMVVHGAFNALALIAAVTT